MTDQNSEARLQRLGYKQELERTLNLFASFGIAFCYISPVVGVYTLFGYGLSTAGPAFVWSIPLVAAGQFTVAFVFAEIGSAYPLAGALYHWGRYLVGQRFGWMVGWIYGWALLVTIAAVDYAGAPYVAQLFGIDPQPHVVMWITIILLVVHTVFNIVGVKASAWITNLGVFGEVMATVVIAAILISAGLPQNPRVLMESAGIGDGNYAPHFMAGALASVWIFYGFESAAGVAEEVVDASKRVPRAILLSLAGAVVVTTFLVVTLVLAAPSIEQAMEDPAKAIPFILEARLGVTMQRLTFILIIFAYFSCATAIQAACARLVYAYARDRMVPAHMWLGRITEKHRVPQNALLLTGAIALVAVFLTQINLGNVNANAVIVSYAVLGVYLSFQLIVFAYLRARSKGWRADGDFRLGRWGTLTAVAAQIYGVVMLINLAWPRPANEPAGWFPLISASLVLVSGGFVLGLRQKPTIPETGGVT